MDAWWHTVGMRIVLGEKALANESDVAARAPLGPS
jgi:hypothetical protein